MATTTPTTPFLISKIYCAIFGHDFQLSQEITAYIKEYKCSHCQKEATTNARGRLEPMTPKLKEINKALLEVHAKKMARKAKSSDFRTTSTPLHL